MGIQWHRMIVGLAAVGLGAGLGCSDAVQRPMAVQVRDRDTGAPVGGALVCVRPVHFFLPTEVPMLGSNPILDPSPPAGHIAATDTDGAAVITGLEHHPVEVTVLAPGHAPLDFRLDAFPLEPTDWLGGDGAEEGQLPACQARCGPTDG